MDSNVPAEAVDTQDESMERSKGLWAQAAGQLLRRPKAIFGITVILLLYGGGILASFLAPQGYNEQDLFAVRQGPSMDHWLGTDFVGRDVLSRTIFSLRTNLIITAASVATGSLVIGVTMGLVSGYIGGKLDTLIMRVGEVFLAFPGLLLVILLAATLKPRVLDWVRDFEDATGIDGLVRWGVADYLVIFGALAAFSWVGVARFVRG